MNTIKKRSKLFFCIGLLVCCLLSCGKKELSAREYVQYLESEKSGARQEKNIADIKIAVQYKTAAYMALKEKREEATAVKETVTKLKGMQYYTIKYSLTNSETDIMKYNLASQSDYYERLNYMSFGMQNDASLIQGKDTLSCVLFNHVRNYGISPYTEIVLGFEETENELAFKENKTLLINDRAFGLGYLKFLFQKNDLNDLPELITE